MQRYQQICLRCAALVALLLWGTAALAQAQANTLNLCRTIVAVGLVKAKNVDPNQVAQGLSAALSQGTEVQAVPILNVSNEQALREQAARYKPDYLILVEADAGQSTKDSILGGLIGCGRAGGIPCTQVKTVYKIKYRVEESASAKTVATTAKAVQGSHEDPQQALVQVAVKLGEVLGGVVRDTVTNAPTFERLQRRAICYAGFPENPASLILKFDVQTATKKVSIDQYAKGPLWRVSIRPKGAASPFISGYNGKTYWTLNRQEGIEVFTPQNAPRAGNRLNFLAGEFLDSDDASNLKREVARATLVAPESVNNRKCQVVEARTRADTYIRFCYDAVTGALLKKSILDENREIVQESTFDDYREVAPGVRFPFVVYSKNAKGEAKIEFVEVRINAAISDDYFLRPTKATN